MMKCALRRLVSMPKNKCQNRREKLLVLEKQWRMTAITSASPKAVVLASMLC